MADEKHEVELQAQRIAAEVVKIAYQERKTEAGAVEAIQAFLETLLVLMFDHQVAPEDIDQLLAVWRRLTHLGN